MQPKTVLVVEDNDKSLKLFCALLELNGFRPVGARTIADAVAVARTEQPALVLMDIHLPDGEGTRALGELRADPMTAHVPVVAVTAYAMRGDREHFLAAGFDGYVTKPIDADTFVDEVMGLVDGSGTAG